MNFDVETIRMSTIFKKNISVLFNLRNLYVFEEYFFEQLLGKYLPDDSYLVSEEKLITANKNLVDLIVFKFIEKTKNFLSVDSKLYIYTLF